MPGDEPEDGDHPNAESPQGKFNVPLPTAGGNQWWTDHRYRAGWRIQQNALTGHWRLLDDKDVRRCWGSRAACEAALRDAQPSPDDAAASDHVVILLHGLMRTRRSMASLQKYLQERMEAEVITISYASTRAPIADHARALRQLVEALPGKPRIDFVGHSMGNIVVRHAIGDWEAERPASDELLGRLGRIVMLGPPNQGAAIARRLGKLGLFAKVLGQGGMQLGRDWQRLLQHLATPPCPFAIVAGNLPSGIPSNPLVDGESDFIVSVEEARLEGASAFHEVPFLHSFLMDRPQVQAVVAEFLTADL